MKELENELRRVLARREPPPGFADRVLRRVPERKTFRWLPAAAALVIGIFGAGSYEYRKAQEASQAKTELIYALEITSYTLQQTKAKLFKQTRGEL